MPHKIYVGNYPLSFVEDDVLNLFQDFEGVELVGFFRNKNKCYSFLHCVNERQLVEIVANLHAIDVCGRNLIVRAADENLQKRIQGSISRIGAVNVHPRDTSDVNCSTSVYGNYGYSESSKPSSSPQMVSSYSENTYPKKYEMSTGTGHSPMPNTYHNSRRITKQNDGIADNSESHDYSSHFSEFDSSFSQESDYPIEQKSHYAQNSFSHGSGKSESSYYHSNESERKNSDLSFNPQETFSRFSKSKTNAPTHYKTMNERFGSYEANSMHNIKNPSSAGKQATEEYRARNRNASESSVETVHNRPRAHEYDNLSFVSVVNFPLYMPTRDLYKLFSDFNPIKVFIVCNEARMDKTPTEALICFESEKEATDAMLTLDNTVYQGRVLIVTDAVDRSLVSELLSF